MYCNKKPCAKAIVKGGDAYPAICGEVLFYPAKHGVLVTADVSGLPQNGAGFFGFHIHEGNSCAGEDFAKTGGHFNPAHTPHPQHAGDLPPLLSCAGKAFLAVKTDRFRIDAVIGKTVVIHGGTDDFRTQPSGDAGEKIACGVINTIIK